MESPVSAVIQLDAFRRNLQAIREKCRIQLCPAVKADGYGHGIELLLPVLSESKIEALAVAQLEEALSLRRLGWRSRILCLGAPLAGGNPADCRERACEALAAGIECTLSSREELDLIRQVAANSARQAQVQIKIDTGMGRMGLLPGDALDFVLDAAASPCIRIAGVYTHFATADEPDLSFARLQLENLLSLRARLQALRCPVRAFHAANSAGIFCLADSHLDMVRPGLASYGYWGGHPDSRPSDLRPILRLLSRIVSVRCLPAGTSIGYGRTFRTDRQSVIGVVPIGYADGFRRALGNAAVMTIESRRGAPRKTVPVVGRISMDMLSIDLTGVPDVRTGDRVVILDDAPESPNSVESIARRLGTIPYEITCAIGPRAHRCADSGNLP